MSSDEQYMQYERDMDRAARLRDMAPDFLKALITLEHWIKLAGDDNVPEQVISEVRYLIAKAEGRV